MFDISEKKHQTDSQCSAHHPTGKTLRQHVSYCARVKIRPQFFIRLSVFLRTRQSLPKAVNLRVLSSLCSVPTF